MRSLNKPEFTEDFESRIMGWVIFLSTNISALVVYIHVVARRVDLYQHLFAIPAFRICSWMTALLMARLMPHLRLSRFAHTVTLLGILTVMAIAAIAEFRVSTQWMGAALLLVSVSSQAVSIFLLLAEKSRPR